MRKTILLSVIAGVLLVPSVLSAQAPPGAPAGTTGKCKDGTFSSAATKQGACRGHKGIDTWYAAVPAKEAAASPSAKSAAAPSAPASGGTAAGATGKCKDGTFTIAATKQGACRGHQGVDTWFAAAATPPPTPAPRPQMMQQSAPAPVAGPAPAPASAPAAAPSRSPAISQGSDKAAAPGGGPGMVWVNTQSNVYHCYGSHWYGITKAGKYMPEQQATAAGARPDHGRPCSK